MLDIQNLAKLPKNTLKVVYVNDVIHLGCDSKTTTELGPTVFFSLLFAQQIKQETKCIIKCLRAWKLF